MAESVMRHYHAQTALTDRFIVDSAGTSGFHAGERADPRTLAVLARHGAPQPSRSRALTPEDFNSYDWIIGMDKGQSSKYGTPLSAGCVCTVGIDA